MTPANPDKRVAPVKQISRLLKKFFAVGITNVKELLSQWYGEVKSLRRLSRMLKTIGVTIRVNDLLILLEYFGIPRVSKGKHLNKNKRRVKSFPVDDRVALYLWGFCFGDARLAASLSTIRIDIHATWSTVFCIYSYLINHISIDYMSIGRLGNYIYFSAVVDKTNFSFLLNTIDETADRVNDINDLAALLAGLIDAEGSIYVKVRSRKYAFNGQIKQYVTLDHHIEITNCDHKLLKTLQQLLAQHGIKATIPQSKTGFGCSRLRINKRSHLAKLIPLLLNYVRHPVKKRRLVALQSILDVVSGKDQKQRRQALRKLLTQI